MNKHVTYQPDPAAAAAAAHAIRLMSRPRPNRWRVEKAGAPTIGYGRGWMALKGDDPMTATGGWFPTWQEALAFADEQACRDALRQAGQPVRRRERSRA